MSGKRIPYVVENTIDMAPAINDGFRIINGLIPSRVVALVTAPPDAPDDNAFYAIDENATGLFQGKSGVVAQYIAQGDVWEFYNAVICVIGDDLYISNGNRWIVK